MWRNYLVVAWRILLRNRLFTALSVVGLAVGMAATMLIFTYYRLETSYDQQIPEVDQLFRLFEIDEEPLVNLPPGMKSVIAA